MGYTVIVGAAPFGSRFDADWWTLAAGRRVQGSVIGSSDPAVDLPRLIELWRAGDLPLEHLVSPYPFTEINTAVAAMASGDVVKPVVVMERPGGRRMSSPDGNLFVDGAWTDGGDEAVELVDPSRNLPFATVSLVDEAGIDRAIASARAAFDGGGWSGRSVQERVEPLLAMADFLEANAATYGDLLLQEVGLPVPFAYGNLVGGAHMLRYYASIAAGLSLGRGPPRHHRRERPDHPGPRRRGRRHRAVERADQPGHQQAGPGAPRRVHRRREGVAAERAEHPLPR